MSTSYRANGATIADAIAAGWTLAILRHGDGELPSLTDGTNYAHDVEQTEVDGQPVLWFERYGQNDVSDLVEALGAISEHDEGFWDGIDTGDEDEALAIAESGERCAWCVENGVLNCRHIGMDVV